MLNFNSLMVGTTEPKKLRDYYNEVFQKEPDMSEEGAYGWQAGKCFFGVMHHGKMEGKTKDPARLMPNLETMDVKGEFERIKNIKGSEVVKEPYEMGGMWIATFADPDGNYFQLMSPWEE